VEDVQGGAEWVEGLAQFQRLFQLVGLGVGAVLALAAILTVTTATTLVLHLRRDEMEIMRLVGAAESVIRLPRLLQGMAQGLVAGTLALAVLEVAFRAGGAPARAPAPGDARVAARGLPVVPPDARPHRRRYDARRDRRAPGDEADPRMTGQTPQMRGMIRLATAAALALALAGVPAVAQKRGGADIGEKQQDLQKTQKRLNEERQKAAEAKKREAGLLAELESIDKRVTDKRKQVVTLDGRIKKAQGDISDLQADIGKLVRQRLGQEEVLERRLRAVYKLEARGGALPLLLSGDDPVAKAVQLRHLTTLATVDARLIREYRVTSEGLAERKSRLEARQKDLTGLRSEVDEERAEADREGAKRQVLLARVKDERAYHDRMVGELSEAARRLEAFIQDLQEKQRRAAAAARAAPPAGPVTPCAPDRSCAWRLWYRIC
jgi:peptidoglycan hydrolase CwlO-like protein